MILIDYFIVCHDQNIILEDIKSDKYKGLPSHRFLFVGNQETNLIEKLENVIVCRNLPGNIEQHPHLCSFTAWYCVSKNNLANQEYVCLLEYDVDIKSDFHQKNIESLQTKQEIYGYLQAPLFNPMFTRSTPWLDIFSLQKYKVRIQDLLNEHCYGQQIWNATTNCLIQSRCLYHFVDWFYNICFLFKDDILGSYAHERMIFLYSALVLKKGANIIHDVLEHKQLCSYGKKDLYYETEAVYEEKLRECAWLVPVDHDFDDEFYSETYKDIQNWYLGHPDVSKRQRLFHHYFLYGQTEKRLGKPRRFLNNIVFQYDTISIDCGLPWQYPSLTEKQAFLNHENRYRQIKNKVYVGCPWASIIDYLHQYLPNVSDFWRDNIESRNYLKRLSIDYRVFDLESHTVCQHVYWWKLLGFWRHIGIKHLYLSHLKKNDSLSDIDLHPWHLIASNSENSGRNIGLEYKKDRKLLCSFIGSYERSHPSDIRVQLKELKSKDIHIELRSKWFYNDIVYETQLNQICLPDDVVVRDQKDTLRYNQILSDSQFSLCPEGSGPNTIRLWESMSVGSIPVLFTNDWVRPEIDMDWNSFSITIDKKDIGKTIDILRLISGSQIDQMRLNCLNAYNIFRLKTCYE